MNSSRRSLGPLWLFLGLLASAGAINLVVRWSVPLPRCGLRMLTGIPCPLCGSTHCLAAWSKLEVAQAFRFNPLVSSGCILFGAWFLLWALDGWSGDRRAMDIWRRVQRKPWPAVLAGAVVLNWIYLVLWL